MPEIAGIDQGDALPGPGGIVGDAAPGYAGANYQRSKFSVVSVSSARERSAAGINKTPMSQAEAGGV